jgi:hypothetical protein
MKRIGIALAALMIPVFLFGCATGISDKDKRKEEQINKANRAQDELSRSTESQKLQLQK